MDWKRGLNQKVSHLLLKLVDLVKKYDLLIATLMFLSLLFLLYYKINIPDIRDWDEARHGANAYEMLRYHQFFINYYGGVPDYWNLKPPLSFWIIMFGYKLFGFNVFGLRFFSGFSIALTEIALFFFARYRFGKIAGLITLASFATCGPIILLHCGRTADPDALFLLFVTLALISLLLTERRFYFLYFTGFFFSLAFLTKSWHAFSVLIIAGLYYVMTGRIAKLKPRNFIIFFLTAFVPILLWAIKRYSFDRFTFFSKMVRYDLIRRSSSVLDTHSGGKLYYLNFIEANDTYWFLLFCALGLTICVLLNRSNWNRNKNIGIGLLLWLIVPFIIFLLAKSKLYWYIYILFPAISLFIGLAVDKLLQLKKTVLTIVVLLFIVFSFYTSFMKTYRTAASQSPSEIQMVFEHLNRSSKYRLANVYTDDTITWRQSTYLSALLFADLKPKDTGITGFVLDRQMNSLLVMANNQENKKIMHAYHFHSIYSNPRYIMVSK
ncbi:ArnT family glycosyltransferase [Sporolactobacillus spathodeae]|uniref:4-amino-4-deoxy-L-arabinose transferase-like glycosyltransferase n=1 Tax=Sporolactobacillus spathodeae TaxID=1465502 RepID=A0ABS2Q8J7_9BACL|nr:glycosyltransferase family 39 protein [Sporolactobacillus spathodeae]MBM7657765.1 4-amino-4-deoxy-L-arabinose transferase-like glycosyltransferase [Sporolactobacillus spathodeae]